MTYYYRDHLSNRSLASSTGATTGSVSTFPFGESRLQSGAATKWQFTSYERDNAANDSGLDYANARFYSSRIGRFTSTDPLTGSLEDPQSLNRYSYVSNDPINTIDPSGLQKVCMLAENGRVARPISRFLFPFRDNGCPIVCVRSSLLFFELRSKRWDSTPASLLLF
jgi:RHS repeat-associated protein